MESLAAARPVRRWERRLYLAHLVWISFPWYSAQFDFACHIQPSAGEKTINDHRQPPGHDEDATLGPDPADLSTEHITPTDLLHETIGPYRLLEVLGEGGMGIVYLAEQQEPIRRRVALKIIKLGMDTREVIARFESERQALAMMNHPNIARVLDAGATDSGRPYFVMEHVPGVPITDYCDRHKLTTRRRLDLFRRVCRALHHAHQKGIIHRDIKPSNVLICVQDGEPVPKVIDFGVAKAIDQVLTEKTVYTQQGKLIGTPAYMSPEQAEMTGLNVDTTSDVYSLGVLLYELLTGSQPFDKTELRQAGLLEIHRIIREVEPPRPSTRVGDLGLTGTELAQRRRVEPRAWRRLLRGELDWITMRAMEKDRTRRYASASEFAADITHYLQDEPVAASPPSTAYRVGKFVRRHRGMVVAVGGLIVVLAGGIVGIGAMLNRALEAESEAAHEAERARIELDRSRQVTAFTSEMLSGIDPEIARGKDQQLLRLILDDAAERLDVELSEQPEVAAALHAIIGRTYESIEEYGVSEHHYQRALDLRRAALGEEHRETLLAEDHLAGVYSSMGRYAEAEEILDRILDLQRRLIGEEDPETLSTLNDLALLCQRTGRIAEAESLGVLALEARRRVLGDDHRATLTSSNNLALTYASQGRFDQAAELLQQTVDGRRAVLGDDHPKTLLTMGNLAAVEVERDRLDRGERIYIELIESQKRIMGEDSHTTLSSLNNLGLIYRKQERYAEAESLYAQVLAVRKRTLGEDHPETLNSLLNFARLHESQEHYDEAERLNREALAGFEQVLGPDHPRTIICLNNLATVYLRQERYGDAEPVAARAIAGARNAFPADHWLIGIVLNTHGGALRGLGRHDEAETDLLAAHGILAAARGEDDERTHIVVEALVKLYDTWGRPERAAIWREKLGP